jgi:hypothetical protein
MCTDDTKSVVLLCAASILRYVCSEHQHEMQDGEHYTKEAAKFSRVGRIRSNTILLTP